MLLPSNCRFTFYYSGPVRTIRTVDNNQDVEYVKFSLLVKYLKYEKTKKYVLSSIYPSLISRVRSSNSLFSLKADSPGFGVRAVYVLH